MTRWVGIIAVVAGCNGSGADTDTAAPEACADVFTAGAVDLDPTGPDTQIHATATFDGQWLWTAWNRPDAGSNFDVWLSALDCRGAVVVPPVELTGTDDNELDPVLAAGAGGVLAAWGSSTASSANNLDIRYRLLGSDGTPTTGPIELVASRDGVEVTGNAALPDVTAGDAGYVLAGSWGHDDAPAFQAFSVEIDTTGAVVGEAEDGELDTAFGQTDVSVAHGAGLTHLVWQEDSTTSTAPAISGATLGEGSAQFAAVGARPDVAVSADGVWRVWDDDAGSLVLRLPSGAETVLSTSGTVHSPSLAAFDGGAFVLGLEIVSGVANRVLLWRVDTSGQVTADHALATNAAVSVYGAEVVAIDPNRVVVVYTESVSPGYAVRSEWVSFAI